MVTRHPSLVSGLGLCSLMAPVAVQAVQAVSPPALALAREAASGVSPAGYLVSEKYDGVRALWTGQQLLTRGGLPIAAPAWFLSALPATALDGELWLGRGQFDALSGLVRSGGGRDADWHQVRYMVYEQPDGPGSFAQRLQVLRAVVAQAGFTPLQLAPQDELPDAAALRRRLAEVVAAGGEGLVLHRADAPYQVGRSDALLKLKPVQDADAVVIGHLPGQGKYVGRTGALRVRDAQGREFQIGSGLSDAQRASPPPLGSTVSYRWRGLTGHGLPRFATLWRVREPGW